jgi:hypothetical protein
MCHSLPCLSSRVRSHSKGGLSPDLLLLEQHLLLRTDPHPVPHGWIAGYVTANSSDVLLDIPKLLREEDSQRFLSICAHFL